MSAQQKNIFKNQNKKLPKQILKMLFVYLLTGNYYLELINFEEYLVVYVLPISAVILFSSF